MFWYVPASSTECHQTRISCHQTVAWHGMVENSIYYDILEYIKYTLCIYIHAYWYILACTSLKYILVYAKYILCMYLYIQMFIPCNRISMRTSGGGPLMYFIHMRRTLLLLFHLILTALRRIVMMLPWKTVGMYVPSSSSSTVCVLSMESAEEHDVQSRSRYIQVYTCIS